MLAALLLVCSAAEEIPPIVRASPHFYGAIGGSTLSVSAIATPPTLTLGESTILTLTVVNARNPGEIRRPVLTTEQFTVENLTDSESENARSFRYKLTPRVAGMLVIPSLQFDYYMPEAAEGKRLRTTYASSISIIVHPKVPRSHFPDRLRTHIRESATWGPRISPAMWYAAPIGIAMLTAFWIVLWRARNPQGAQLARLRRSRAVRTAFARIDRGQTLNAMRGYLQSQFGVPTAAMTPGEIRNSLAGRVSAAAMDELEALLRDADAERFAGEPGVMANRARSVIEFLEESS